MFDHSVRCCPHLVALSAAVLLCMAVALPSHALADDADADEATLNPGGVVLQDWGFSPRTTNAHGELHPHPFKEFVFVQLMFNKNVSYPRTGDDDAFVQENAEKITLRRADGAEVDTDWSVFTSSTFDERAYLGVLIDGWLEPLTDYEVVVAPGIKAANGVDVTDQEYVIPFRTSEECADGLTVYQKAIIVMVTCAVMAGVVVCALRMWCERRL